MGRYLRPDDPRILHWNDELTKALPAGKAVAFLTMADVAHLTGDMDLFERLIARAETHGASEMQIRGRLQSAYNNLGYASKSLEQLRGLFSIQSQNVGIGLPRSISSGGFEFARTLLAQARLANLDLSHVDQIDEIRRIAEGTRDIAVPDEQYARVLDIAGDVMRAHSLLWLDRAPRYSFDDEMACPGIRYRLEVTPEEAVEIGFEFIDRLLAEDLDHIPLSVGFIGVIDQATTEA